MEIIVNSSTMGKLIIKEIPKELAKEICIKYHYSHKWNILFGKINIGIFQEGIEECLGVAVFGYMMQQSCYPKYGLKDKEEILELNRMWIDDRLGKNAESILISKSFKIIKQIAPHVKIIQSFSDGRLGYGAVYQASNFKYYGYTTTDFMLDIESGEYTTVGQLRNTHKISRMILEHKKVLNGTVKFYKVKSYRYLYPLRKGALKGVQMQEQEYPKFKKGMVEFKRNKRIKELIRCYIGCVILNLQTDEEIFYKEIKGKTTLEEIITTIETNDTLKRIIRINRKTIEEVINYIKENY